MGKILGLDYGDSRIGVALSDEFKWTAGGLCVIDSKRSAKKARNEVCDLIVKHKVEAVVIGYPLNMNGSKGPRVEITDKFIEELSSRFPQIPMIKWDERLTSIAANKAMLEMGISQKVKGMNDMLAAVFILQGYLNSLTNKI